MSRLVFSYGSNSSVQLRARVKNADLQVHPARVFGWERIFCLQSPGWGNGAVASLARSEEGLVHGAAVYLTPEEVSRLDQFEGGYQKKSLSIRLEDDKEQEGFAYIAVDPEWTVPPSEQYLTACSLMLREHWREEISTNIQVNGVLGEDDVTPVTFLYNWRHPGSHALSLAALCVEVNALRKNPWVMPRTIRYMQDVLSSQGIESAAQLAVHLCNEPAMEKLADSLKDFKTGFPSEDQDHFHVDSLRLFRTVLRL